PRPAINVSPAAAAPPSTGSTACTQSSARARRASPRIPPTWAWRSPHSRPRCTWPGLRASARSRLPISIGSPATCRRATPTTSPAHDEIVTAVELPPQGFAANYTYLKIRDRLSYAFALVSIAAALELEGGTIKEARLALGGVAHKPWRDKAAEAALRGEAANRAAFTRAADVLLREARGYAHNSFKTEFARRGIVRALTQAAQGTPQSQSDKKIR